MTRDPARRYLIERNLISASAAMREPDARIDRLTIEARLLDIVHARDHAVDLGDGAALEAIARGLLGVQT